MRIGHSPAAVAIGTNGHTPARRILLSRNAYEWLSIRNGLLTLWDDFDRPLVVQLPDSTAAHRPRIIRSLAAPIVPGYVWRVVEAR